MKRKIEFDDGSMVEWKDRDNVEYSKNGRSVLVCLDFERAFFNGGRILMVDSLKQWKDGDENLLEIISGDEKIEIILKIFRFFEGKKLRIE